MPHSAPQRPPCVRRILATIAAAVLGAMPLEAEPPVRILPVGDSITYGSSVAGGYRRRLYQLLTAAGYNVDFVGTQTGNGAADLPDPDHEGHGGWRIDQIDSIILSVFNTVADPDVILVLIGTNDFGQGVDTTNAINRLDTLIGKMATGRPYAKIVVANLLERNEPYNTQIQTLFNPYVAGVCSNHAALGQQVYFDDLRSALPVTDMPDSLHPGALGYDKMATNWFNAVTNLISPQGTTNAPAISHVNSPFGGTNLLVTFSKPVADTAADPGLYSLSGGLAITAATLDSVTKRDVTLTTSPQAPLTQYTLSVSGIVDRTAAVTPLPEGASATFRAAGTGARGVFTNVQEAAEYSLVYSLNIPSTPSYAAQCTYDLDLRSYTTNFTRVGYYMELIPTTGDLQFAWVSFDAFTNNTGAIGVPTTGSGAIFQQPVTNMNVLSSMAGVAIGTNLSGGNIEFWPHNYAASNALAVAGASSSAFDWGDVRSTSGNYGSMQVHNHDASQVIFAFNRWGGTGGNADLGIGNRPGSADVDWTFAQNAAGYTVKLLQVFALPASNPPPVIAGASVSTGVSNVVVRFSKPIADDVTAACFTIPGLTVLDAALDPVTKSFVTLTTSVQMPNTAYSLTITGVTDRTSARLPLAPPATVPFLTAAKNGFYDNVPDAAGYTLVYSLNVPTTANYNTTGVVYAVDNHLGIGAFSRIGYYVETQKAGQTPQFAWVTMDPFTQDAGRIGVPAAGTGALFQQPLTNMSYYTSLYGVQGAARTGNIEFWSSNYAATNSAGVTNASSAVYDWGDQPTAGNHGSMQIHDPEASQVLFAMNNWGGGGTIALGIGNNTGNANPDWTFMDNAGTYTSRLVQVYVQTGTDTTPPSVLSAAMTPDRNRIVVTFDEPVAASALEAGRYGLDNGGVVRSAAFGSSLRQVILTVDPLQVGLAYTLTLTDVRDRSANANPTAPGTSIAVDARPFPPQVAANVPETSNFVLACQLEIPVASPNWNATGAVYAVDNRYAIGLFDRTAYYMELVSTNGTTSWSYASMDPFTNDLGKIAVPDMTTLAVFQKPVSNLNVFSSQTNIVQGTGMTGNIEFWPFSYTQANGVGVSGASGSTYDLGDTMTLTSYATGGYGSMQVHNTSATQTVFALNRWGGGNTGNIDVGIGNRAATDPDWTFAQNAASFSARRLYVLVRPVANDTNGPVVVDALADSGRTKVLLRFDEPLANGAADPLLYSADGGLSVTAAAMRPNLRDIELTTSPQTPGAGYNIAIAGVTDRSANANPVASNTVAAFTAVADLPPFALVPEATNYTLVYGLSLPSAPPNYNTSGIVYDTDKRSLINRPFNRIAYFLELDTNWIYVSTDAFTTNINRTGVPVAGTGAGFQQKLANVNVYSSQTNVPTGIGQATCNIEFWHLNYSAATTTVVNTGSTTNLDWNDTYSTGGQYGSMQIHNYGSNSVLFAFNRWGGGQTLVPDLGIGNTPGTNNADWTFSGSSTNYTIRNLYVMVRTTNAPPVTPVIVPPALVQQPLTQTNQAGGSARLTGAAVGSDGITYQWRRDGSPLDGETNAWLDIPSVQVDDAGIYDVVVANAGGVVTSRLAVITVNRAPLAVADRIGTLIDTSNVLALATILDNDSDPDGDPFEIQSVGPASLNGGVAGMAGTNALYTPPAAYEGPDSFAYVLADTRGGVSTGTVLVTVMAPHSPDVVGRPTLLSNGTFRIQFAGVSNGTYSVDWRESMTTGDWSRLINVMVGEDGAFAVEDGTQPPPRQRFYRATAP